MDKKQPNPEHAIAFDEMLHLIKSFSRSHQNAPLWREAREHLWTMERKRRQSKHHFYTAKKFPYFCKRIDRYLEAHDTLRLKFSTLLAERRSIGLKMQLLLHPVLLHKIERLCKAFPERETISGNKVSRWELSNNESQELAHFIKSNFGKLDIELTYLERLRGEVKGVLHERERLISNKRDPSFKRSPDKKHCYFFNADETEKWHIVNQHFFDTNILYDDAYLAIQIEESPFKKNRLRFTTLYQILYPKTKSAIIFVRISDIVSELEDLQGLINERRHERRHRKG